MRRLLRPRLTAGLSALVALLAFAAIATANQTFHTLTAPFSPVDGQPLQSGWVHDIHMNGNPNSGHEVYHVAGAIPNTTFDVHLLFYAGGTCSGIPAFEGNTAVLMTTGAGSANGDVKFGPNSHTSTVTTMSAIWQLLPVVNGVAGPPDYATPCEVVLIGGK